MKVKNLKIILFVICNITFSMSLFANEVIKLTWSAVPISYSPGYSGYKNIKITAPENKTFTINWGDGSSIETKIGTGDKQILSHTYADAESYIATITGSNADCLFTYFDCTNNGVTNLDICTNISLKTLLCSNNWLTEVDISHCPDLEYFDCSYNSLNELDISTNTKLIHLNCRSNDTWVNMQGYGRGISYLDFSNCELTYLDCSYNSLPLSNLYVASEMIDEIENKNFANQTIIRAKIITDVPVDFSSEKEFGGIATVFDVKKDCWGTALEGVDYTINEGIITFLVHELCNSGFILTMTNTAIPTASVTASFRVYDFMHILSDLTVSEGILEPEFNSINFDYTVTVSEDISEIILSATPNNPNTIVSGTGLKTLNLGENNFIVNALTWYTENEGTSLDYKIKVIRGTVGITNIDQSSKIKIYPNPANNIVEIDLGNNFMQYQSLYVYDLMGKLCLIVAVTQEKQQINIQNLPVGNYIVQTVGKGRQYMSEKLIIIR